MFQLQGPSEVEVQSRQLGQSPDSPRQFLSRCTILTALTRTSHSSAPHWPSYLSQQVPGKASTDLRCCHKWEGLGQCQIRGVLHGSRDQDSPTGNFWQHKSLWVRNQMAIPSLRTGYPSCMLARVFGLTHFLQRCDVVFVSTETGTEAQIRVLIHQDVL